MHGKIAGCSFCGSPRIYPKNWVGGFLVTINAERQVYCCRDCDREGILLLFRTEEERVKFAAECAQENPR